MCVCVCVFSQWNKEGRMSDLTAAVVKRTPTQLRVNDRGCQESIQIKSMICCSVIKPKIVHPAHMSVALQLCVSVRLSECLGQSKQLLLGKCGLCCRSGADLFAHGQMIQRYQSLSVLTSSAPVKYELSLFLHKHCSCEFNWRVLV